MRKIIYIVGGVLALILIIALALPFLIDANQFRPRVEAEAGKALGRTVKVGNLTLSLFAGGVRADDLSVSEDPAYGKGPFLTAKSMNIGVEMLPLITSKKLNIRSFTITDPKVNLIRGTNGKWNVSTLGAGANAKKESSSTDLSVGKFALNNGTATIIQQGSSAKPSVYSKVDLTATDVSLNSKFPFTFTAVPPGGGTIRATGDFGPMAKGEAVSTPLNAKVEVRKFDLAQSGFMEPSSGIRGLVDLDADIKSDGKSAKIDAKGTGTQLALVPNGSPAKVPVGLDLAADYNLVKNVGDLTRGVLKIGNSPANIAGTFDTSGAVAKLNMKVDANSLAIGDIDGLLPALGVVLPSGASLQGGSASAHATASGPTNALVTNGVVNVQNTKLTGFDLGSKMSAVAKLAGIQAGGDTPIQLFASNLRMAPAGTQIDNIKLIVPSLGTLTGAGTIGSHNELDFKMRAELQNASGTPLGALSQVAGVSQKNATIPFKIGGTTSNPVFVPDVGGTLGTMVQGQGQPGAAGVLQNLGGLFGKKKK